MTFWLTFVLIFFTGGIGGLLARTDGNGSTFYHADRLGNITALMDGNQNVPARYLYNPFGKLIGEWGSMAGVNEMQFSSMPERDGLALYPFRAYEPNFQRWLNQDPIQEAGGINLYQANFNDPLRYVDPFGLQDDVDDVIPEPAETPQEQFQDALDENQVFGAQRPGIPDIQPDANWENEPKLPEGRYEADIARATQEIADDLQKDSEPKIDNTPKPGVSCPQGSLNPATRQAASLGSRLHADRPGNLPDQLRSMFPETEFKFTPPGKSGQDAEVTGGLHPSFYPYGDWPEGVNYGDFKPDTATGLRTFNSDQQSKWNAPTIMLTYDPGTGKLTGY